MRTVLILIFLFSHIYTVHAQELSGKWNFNSITNKAGDTLIPIMAKDFMLINADETFHYELAAKNNLVAKGTWTLKNNELCYTYSLPGDTTRCYRTSLINNELILKEGNLNFSFIRNEQGK